MALDQEPAEPNQKVALRRGMRRQPQVLSHVGEKLLARQTRIEDVCVSHPILVQQFLQTAHNESLSGSDLSSQNHETLRGLDSVVEPCQRLLVLGGRVKKGRIGADLEGTLHQLEEVVIHVQPTRYV